MSGKKRSLLNSSPEKHTFVLNSDDDDNITIASAVNNSASKRSNTKKSAEKLSNRKKSAEKKSKLDSNTAQGRESTPMPKYSFRKRDPQKIQYFTNTTWVNPSTIPDDPSLDLDILLEPVEGFDFEAKLKLKHKDQRDDDFVPPAESVPTSSRPRKYRRLFKRSHLSPPPTTPQIKQKRTWGKNPSRLGLSTINPENMRSESQARGFDYDFPSPTLPTAEELLGLLNPSRDIARNVSKKSSLIQYIIPSSPPLPSNRSLLYSPQNTLENPREFTFSDSELDYRLPSFTLTPSKKSTIKTRSRHLSFLKFYNSQLSSLYYVPQWLKLVHRTYRTRERLGLIASDSPWDKWIIEERGKTNESIVIRFRHHFGPRQLQTLQIQPRFKVPKFRDSRTTLDSRAIRTNSSSKGSIPRIPISDHQQITESPTHKTSPGFSIRPPKIFIQTFRHKPPTTSETNIDGLNIDRSGISVQSKPFGNITDLNRVAPPHSSPASNTFESTSITTNPKFTNQPVIQDDSPSTINLSHHSTDIELRTTEAPICINDDSSSTDLIINYLKASNTPYPRQNINNSNNNEMSSTNLPPHPSINTNITLESNTNAGNEDILTRLGFTSNNTSTSTSTNIGDNSSNSRISSNNRDINSNSSTFSRNQNSMQSDNNRTIFGSNMVTRPGYTTSHSNPTSFDTGRPSTKNDRVFAPTTAISTKSHNEVLTFSNPSEVNSNEIEAIPEKTLGERKTWLNKFSERLWKIHHPEQPKLPKLKRVESIIQNSSNLKPEPIRTNSTFNFNELDFELDSDHSDIPTEEVAIIPRDDITRTGVQFEYSKPSKPPTTLLVEPLEISSDAGVDNGNDNDSDSSDDHWTNNTSTQSRSRLSRSLVLRSSSNTPPPPIHDFNLSKDLYSDVEEPGPQAIDLTNFTLDDLDDLDYLDISSESWTIEDNNNWEDLDLTSLTQNDDDDDFNFTDESISNINEVVKLMGIEYHLKIPKHTSNLIELCINTIFQILFQILNNSVPDKEQIGFVLECLNLLQADGCKVYFKDRKEYLVKSINELINSFKSVLNKVIIYNQNNRVNYLNLIFLFYFKILNLLKNFNNSIFLIKFNNFFKILLNFELNEILQSWEIKNLKSRNLVLEWAWRKVFKLYSGEDWLMNNWSNCCELLIEKGEETNSKIESIMEYGTAGQLPSWSQSLWPKEVSLTVLERTLLPLKSKINEVEGIDNWLLFGIDIALDPNFIQKFKNSNAIENINYYLHWQDRIEIVINQLGWTPTELFLTSLFQLYKEKQYIQLNSKTIKVEDFEFFNFKNETNFLSNYNNSDYFVILNWLRTYLRSKQVIDKLTNRSLLIFLSKVFPTQSLKLKSNHPQENFQSFINRIALLMVLALTCPSSVINLNTLLKRLKVTFVPEWQLFDHKALYIIGLSNIELIGVRLVKFSDDGLELDNFAIIQKALTELHSKQFTLNNNLIDQLPLAELDLSLQTLIKLYSKLGNLVSSLNICSSNSTGCKLLTFTMFINNIKVKNIVSPLTRLPHQLKFHYLCLFKNLLQKLTNSPSDSTPPCLHHNSAKELILEFIKEDNWKTQLKFLKSHLELDICEVEDNEELDKQGKISIMSFLKIIDYFLNLLNNNS